MKRASIAVAAVMTALALMAPAAQAQFKGTPASITSIGMGGKSFTPGPPASVTSMGPVGYGFGPCANAAVANMSFGCTNSIFTPGLNFPTGQGQFGNRFNNHSPFGHRRGRGNGVAVYVPYAYPIAVPYDYAQGTGEMVVDPSVAEPDPPAPTVFERRPTETYSRMRQSDPASFAAPPVSAGAQSEPAREAIPVVLIYKDGHEQEVRNYAIVGKTLYDLGAFVAHKIPLSDLDLPATIKANEDRGVEFNLPSSLKSE